MCNVTCSESNDRVEAGEARRARVARLESEITELAGHLNAANHRFLSLIAQFDRESGWNGGGTLSCAHWLNWKCGIDLGAAREKVRVAHALEALPLISAAMAAGELSYSKVRALTRVATEATEADLLMIARHGTAAHVERLVRGFRRAQEALELDREARQIEGRSLRWSFDDDGSMVIKARLPAEAGALLMRAIDAAIDAAIADRSGEDISAETSTGTSPTNVMAHTPSDTYAQHRADALAVMAESYLAHGPASRAGGERQQIVVHVDAATLMHRQAGRCEFEDGPALAAETARRLACDASRITLIEDAQGQPLDVGRRTRTIPPAIGRALRSRDKGCRFPGCTHTRFVDGHHIEHWADGGATRLSNLVLLCRRHHRLVHEGGVQVRRLDDGALQFLGTDGIALTDAQPLSGHAGALRHAHERDRIDITPDTAVTRWAGERLDYGIAVGCLMEMQKRSMQEQSMQEQSMHERAQQRRQTAAPVD